MPSWRSTVASARRTSTHTPVLSGGQSRSTSRRDTWSCVNTPCPYHGSVQPPSWFLALVLPLAAQIATDPFAFFRPTAEVTDAERRRLLRGEPISILGPSRGHELTIFAAVPVNVDGDRLTAWIRDIAAFKKSSFVLAIGRFSDPPRIDDLASLTLEPDDLEAIRQCRPGRCDMKLTAPEIRRLQRIADDAGDQWKPALNDAFRAVVLQRVQTYVAGGLSALPPLEARREPLSLDASFRRLLQGTELLARGLPALATALADYPNRPLREAHSFLYWSKERRDSKPMIMVTHVTIVRHNDGIRPDVLSAGKQVFATHYVNASLGLTALVRDADGRKYLAYLNRSEVDLLGGTFGGIVRRVMERRLKAEAIAALRGLRLRLESGTPPGSTPSTPQGATRDAAAAAWSACLGDRAIAAPTGADDRRTRH